MTKAIKLNLQKKDTADSFYACSACFNQVQYSDRFCWYCGVVFDVYPVGGGIDYALEKRNSYQKEEKTGWEND